MLKRIISGIALGAALMLGSEVAQAQRPLTFGISGGLSLPTSDMADRNEIGWNAAAALNYNFPLGNFGVRFEGFWNQFAGEGSNPDLRIAGGDVSAFYHLAGPVLRPYVILGLGSYNSKLDGGQSTTDVGINAGGGIKFALAGMNAFTEARLHAVDTDLGDLQFVPIVFGVEF
jgi:hypothetical protein